MELVDANTKNYVFLTLSQYNAEKELVRTRVSMRRDQPFWEGGNSYICCESFRVSSSPSQGGLYYKIFPKEWYMGCKFPQDTEVEPAVDDDDAWEAPLIIPTGAGTHQVGQMLIGVPSVFTNQNQTCSTRVNVWGVASDAPLSMDALQTQDPIILRTYFEKYCNQYFLGNRSWVRLNSSTGIDVNNPGRLVGRLKGNPLNSLTANGLGPDHMYFPDIAVGGVVEVTVSALNVLTTLTKEEARVSPIEVCFRCYAQRHNEQSQTGMSSAEHANLLQQLGKELCVQLRTSHAYPKAWQPVMYGALFKILGLSGVTYHFQQQFFEDTNVDPDDTTVGFCNTAPKFPMRYNKFEAGALCWMVVPIDNDTYTPGTYYGTIGDTNGNLTGTDFYGSTGHLQICVHLHITDAGYDLIKTGAASTLTGKTQLLDNMMILTVGPEAVNQAFHTSIEFDWSQQQNVIDGSNPLNAPAIQDNPSIQFAANRNAIQGISIRRPDKYIYTPNEMFYAFNEKELIQDKYVNLPYNLQTDENGGFTIWWDAVDVQSDEFVIAVDLSDSLGLNPWFEYETEEKMGEVAYNMALVSRVNTDSHLGETVRPIWVEHNSLSSSGPRSPFAYVPLPPPAGVAGAPLVVWLDGVEYTYIRHHQFVENQLRMVTHKRLPTLATDDDGVEYYHYTNLASVGRITNTQMVSVESFSTYSEITIVIPNLPFQSMLGTNSDERILASLRLPFENGTTNSYDGAVSSSTFAYYGDLIFNTLPSRSYLKVTTDQSLYDCDVEVRLIRRDGEMDVMQLPYQGEFQVKLRLLQTQ